MSKFFIFYYSFNYYLILFFLSFFSLKSNYISIPFKNLRSLSSLPKNAEKEKINEYLKETDITIDIKVGTPPQIIPMSLSLWNKFVYISSNSLDIGVYDKDKSTSFKTNNEEPLGDQIYYKKGLYCTDIFNFDSENSKNGDISFILTTHMEYPEEYRKGLIGLQITSYRPEETLINQLKSKEIINNYYHFLTFDNEDNGYFVIGAAPHEYNNKKYSYNNFRQVNARQIITSWELSMTNIKYGDSKFESKNFDLDFRFGMISVGLNMKHEYYNDFFKKRINDGLCEETIYNEYYIYSCINDDKVKYNELKDFHFYNKGLEYDFIFTYKDLFIEFNDRKYFLITYKLYSMATVLGKPFFKKYTIVFNPDNKQIGHYIKIENEEIDKKDFKTNIFFIIIIIILVFVLILLGFILYKFIRKKQRRNIIDDNYDYIPEEKKKTLEMIKV